MLAYIVAAVGVWFVLIGVGVMAFPAFLRLLMPSTPSPKLIHGVVAFRIVAGPFFIFASDACSWPMAVGTVGVFILVAGLAGLFIGMRRIEAMMAWFMKFSDNMFRGWALISVMVGAFIIYAAVL